MRYDDVFTNLVARLKRASWWQLLLIGGLSFLFLPVIVSILVGFATTLVPVALVLAMLAGLVMFSRAWVREFAFLMRLNDDDFPGRNDKLIWAILLIVLPPVGAWLFRSYREAQWPVAETKTAGRVDPLDA